MIYLASPYSHPDAAVREQRFHAACRAVAALIRAEHRVFSSVVHGHALAAHGLPTDWSFWEPQDREHLERCDEVVVLTLEGWEASRGVQAEIQIARELGIPVRYLAPEDAAAGAMRCFGAGKDERRGVLIPDCHFTPMSAPISESKSRNK